MNRSDSGKNERNIPQCGRLIEYMEPHTPFQKLIDTRRKHYGLSGRDLAEKIGVSQSTLWIWLHSVNGFPHPKAFNSEHVRRLSHVLKISEAKIRSALDASRHIFTPRKSPVPYEAFDAMQRFIEIFENDKRKTVSKAYVLHLAKNLHRGSKTTVIAIAALFMTVLVQVRADDLVTVTGKHYENVRITEITPTMIAFIHATGAARLPFTDFGPDVQRKYGYEEAKAKAWLAEQARQAANAEQAQREVDREKREQSLRNMETVEAFLASVGPGELYYDPVTKQIRNADREAEMRGELLKQALKQRYLSGGQSPASSPAPH